MYAGPPPDFSAEHHGITPSWLGPRWVPALPPQWDIAARFRELLRYYVAGVFQGSLLVSATLVLVAAGLPLRGIVLVPFLLGFPAWIVSGLYLFPRRRRPVLLDFAWRFPGLWEWSRQAVVREDRRAASTLLVLHAVLFAVLLPAAVFLWPVALARLLLLVSLAIAAVMTSLALVVLVLRRNSAGLRADEIPMARSGFSWRPHARRTLM